LLFALVVLAVQLRKRRQIAAHADDRALIG
jgi:hypothetical protein